MIQQKPHHITILSVNGSDSTGGSGVQADIKTMSALGAYAVSAITSITIQNTLGIQDFYDLPADVVLGQIEAIINDVQPQVVKIGLVRRADVLAQLAGALQHYRPSAIIYDPVVVSTNGELLLTSDVVDVMKRMLLPLCSLVVLKKADAEHVLGCSIKSAADVEQSVKSMLALGSTSVLMHCGSMLAGSYTDVFASREGDKVQYLTNLCGDIFAQNSHGRSGNFSAAIAAHVSKGEPMQEAVGNASAYIKHLVQDNEALTGRASELFAEFVNEIAANYATHNDVKFYADRLNVSSTYLAQVSKRIAGKAPKSIIDDYVLAQIKALLTTSAQTVQEIAYSLGFGSQAHFSKFFRKMTGQTPSEYRRNYR